jgi:Flp pilus assembly protein TadG
MKKNLRSLGQALLEFALILPVILLIIIVFIDLARVVFSYAALNNAVREGARYATVHLFADSTQRTSDIQQRVASLVTAPRLDPNNVSIYCDQNTTNLSNPCDAYVTVSAHLQVTPVVGFLAKIWGDGSSINITAQSTMQMTPYGSQ